MTPLIRSLNNWNKDPGNIGFGAIALQRQSGLPDQGIAPAMEQGYDDHTEF